MKIAIAGLGYVGLSNAVLLAQHHDVTAVDVSETRGAQVNARQCPIVDAELEAFLSGRTLTLFATTDADAAYSDAEYVIVATPTNYAPRVNYFDTSSVEAVIARIIAVNSRATIVIKSTIPVGYVRDLRRRMETD